MHLILSKDLPVSKINLNSLNCIGIYVYLFLTCCVLKCSCFEEATKIPHAIVWRLGFQADPLSVSKEWETSEACQ